MVLGAELLGGARATSAQLRLQGAGLVVDAGVDDAAVVTRLWRATPASFSTSTRRAPGRWRSRLIAVDIPTIPPPITQ